MTNSRIRNLFVKGLVVALGSVGFAAVSAPTGFFDATRFGYSVTCMKEQSDACTHDYWFYMGNTDQNVLFVDIRERRIKNVKWVLEMPKKGQPDFGKKSELTAMECNCATGEFRIAHSVITDQPWGKGQYQKESHTATEWMMPTPESVGEKLLDMVCALDP